MSEIIKIDAVKLHQELQQLDNADLVGIAMSPAYRISIRKEDTLGGREKLLQAVYLAKLTAAQLPSTIAIRTSTPEAQELVRDINRTLLPQNSSSEIDTLKVTRKKFQIRINDTLRTIECIFKDVSDEQLTKILSMDMLVQSETNKHVIGLLKSGPSNVDGVGQLKCYFVRRRANDGRWYLMMQVQR